MSGRGGGRGGRGGGGGGRGGALSQSKEFLKRSALEAGLKDDRNSMKLLNDITRPELFPDFLWRSSGNGYWDPEDDDINNNESKNELVITKRSASTIYILNKHREIMDRMRRSSHYIRPMITSDVARYNSEINHNAEPDVALLRSMGINGKLANDERYFPVELLASRKKKVPMKRKVSSNNGGGIVPSSVFDSESSLELVATDMLGTDKADASNIINERDGIIGATGDDEDNADEEFDELNEEEEEVEDYTTNYYESENEDDDDGGEATFD